MEKQVGTLIKTFPIKRKISENITYDSLLIFYRDKDGIKRTKFIDRAKVPFYILKDKTSEEATKPPMFIEKEKVEKRMVYSDMLYREIAMLTDSLHYYDSYPTTSSNLKNLLKHPLIYNADMNYSDYYIKIFNEEFDADSNYQLHKCFFDIEVDLMENGFRDKGYSGFPDETIAPCPVNIITLIDGKTNIGYIFACRNKLNKQISEFEKDLENKTTELKNEIESEDAVVLNDIKIKFYETELEMIEAFFNTVHLIDPDYICAWNEGFDVLTLQNRLLKLYKKDKSSESTPYNRMLQTVCDQKYFIAKNAHGEEQYITPKAFYKQNKEETIVDRMDEFTILDGIIWMDQMLLFANVRKGKNRESYALDAIATEILGKEKLDYTGYTIKNLPWLNYNKFVKYNFRDTLLLFLLERENLDIDLIQTISRITNTRVYKAFKKTICLKNYVSKFAELQNFVMNNNKNAKYGNDNNEFENNYLNISKVVEDDNNYLNAFEKEENFGAFVGDPNLNDYCGIETISGKPSMFLFKHVFDEDFHALYPSIITAYNLDKNTQIGKFFLLDSIH